MSGSVLTHGKNVPLKKILKYYFGLKHPKMTTPDGEGNVVSALFPKIKKTLLFPELPFFIF